MSTKIKKGDAFCCIKTVRMDDDIDGEVAYKKGFIYVSEVEDCITDEDNETFHRWRGYGKATKEHFLRIKNKTK
jgi:hypothetical protein